jgi:hypothetical protein
MQYGKDISEMRADLETITKTSMDIPDSHIEAAWMAYAAACDEERPNWSRREMMLLFEYIADGNGDVMLKIEELRAQINRGSEFPGDEIGRWLDLDESA